MEDRQWRKNVLFVLAMAYVALGVIFATMLGFGAPPETAYELVGVPFMALVGGTLAIAKDLL